MPKDYLNRPTKEEARHVVFDNVPRAKSLLTLPGSEALCVQEMLRLGIIDANTTQTWVERDRSKLPRMKQRAKEIGVQPKIIAGNIKEIDPPVRFDFMNMDLEEYFTPSLGVWLEKQAEPMMEDGAILVFTFYASPRNDTPAEFARFFIDKTAHVKSLYDTMIIDITPHLIDSEPSFNYCLLMLACSLGNRLLDIDTVAHYSDGKPMVTFRATANKRKRKCDLPRFSDLVDEHKKAAEKVVVFPGNTRSPQEIERARRREELLREKALIEAELNALED